MINTKLARRWSGSELIFLTVQTAFDERTPYIFTQSIWHLRACFYWYKVLQAVSHSQVSHCPQRCSACLSPHKGMFSKHQWCHTCFSCNTCRIARDAPPSSCLQHAVKDGADAPQTQRWLLVLAAPHQAGLGRCLMCWNWWWCGLLCR